MPDASGYKPVLHDEYSTNFFQCHAVLPSLGGGEETLDRLVHRLVTQPKGAVMHRQDGAGAHVIGHVPGLLGRGVRREIRVVCPDAEDRQVDLADVAEMLAERGVAAEENSML